MAGENVIPTVVHISANLFIPDMSKLDSFDGKNYKMWFEKMEFFLGINWCGLLFVF